MCYSQVTRREGYPKGIGGDRVMDEGRKIAKTEHTVSDVLVVVVSFPGADGDRMLTSARIIFLQGNALRLLLPITHCQGMESSD